MAISSPTDIVSGVLAKYAAVAADAAEKLRGAVVELASLDKALASARSKIERAYFDMAEQWEDENPDSDFADVDESDLNDADARIVAIFVAFENGEMPDSDEARRLVKEAASELKRLSAMATRAGR